MYKLIVSIKSVAPDGSVLQDVVVTEHSATPAEHIAKNMRLAGANLAAFGEMAAEAQIALAGMSAKPTKRRR